MRTLCIAHLLLRALFVVTPAQSIKLCTITSNSLFYSYAQVITFIDSTRWIGIYKMLRNDMQGCFKCTLWNWHDICPFFFITQQSIQISSYGETCWNWRPQWTQVMTSSFRWEMQELRRDLKSMTHRLVIRGGTLKTWNLKRTPLRHDLKMFLRRLWRNQIPVVLGLTYEFSPKVYWFLSGLCCTHSHINDFYLLLIFCIMLLKFGKDRIY